jgi:hypothetical protein
MRSYKLWVDDVRPCPPDAVWAKSTNEAKSLILHAEEDGVPFRVLDLDHDAGDFAKEGGDYVRILDWLEATGRNGYAIHIHSMNPVGRENMLRIAERNGWSVI